jgi:hypothetical protein
MHLMFIMFPLFEIHHNYIGKHWYHVKSYRQWKTTIEYKMLECETNAVLSPLTLCLDGARRHKPDKIWDYAFKGHLFSTITCSWGCPLYPTYANIMKNIVLWDISTKCKQHKPTNVVKTDWLFPRSQAAVWQTKIRQIYMNAQLLIIRNDVYNVNPTDFCFPFTHLFEYRPFRVQDNISVM